MEPLSQQFSDLKSMAPHARGKAFEKFLGHVFSQEDIRHRLSYRPKGEEIDGALWYLKRTFLVEAKWLAEPVPASAVYAFKGKVDGKFENTQGVFFSMSGFSKDCAEAISRGKALNIILFDEQDIESIASGDRFSMILEEKIFAAGQTGNVYLRWTDLKEEQVVQNEIHSQPASPTPPLAEHLELLVVCEGPLDKMILDSLFAYIQKTTGKQVTSRFLVSQGNHPLMVSTAPSLAALLSKGVSGSMAVMTLIDADTLDVNEIERKRQLVTDGLKDLPESWPYHVAVAIPESESWVDLKRRGPSETVREDIMRIDWETIAKHNQEVAEVISFVERVS